MATRMRHKKTGKPLTSEFFIELIEASSSFLSFIRWQTVALCNAHLSVTGLTTSGEAFPSCKQVSLWLRDEFEGEM